jgi:hypothetical protein
MANVPRIQKAPPGKYAGREQLSLDEAEDYLGIKRSTLQTYMGALNIEGKKYRGDRRHWIPMPDVQRIEAALEKPWLAGEDKPATTTN